MFGLLLSKIGREAICIPQGSRCCCGEWELRWKTCTWSVNSRSVSLCVCVCVQGARDTPSARAAQLGPQTLVNLFNSPLYSDVIFMVQGEFRMRARRAASLQFYKPLLNYYHTAGARSPVWRQGEGSKLPAAFHFCHVLSPSCSLHEPHFKSNTELTPRSLALISTHLIKDVDCGFSLVPGSLS